MRQVISAILFALGLFLLSANHLLVASSGLPCWVVAGLILPEDEYER